MNDFKQSLYLLKAFKHKSNQVLIFVYKFRELKSTLLRYFQPNFKCLSSEKQYAHEHCLHDFRCRLWLGYLW